MTASVPEDLRQWFEEGSTLANRYGLRRIDVRFRVVQVFNVMDGDTDEPWITPFQAPREFKTREAAQRYAVKATRELGRTTMVQTGVLFWLRDDEIPGRDSPTQHKEIT